MSEPVFRDDEERYLWHERAAICEYDGGLDRESAEARATKEMELRRGAAMQGKGRNDE